MMNEFKNLFLKFKVLNRILLQKLKRTILKTLVSLGGLKL